MPANLETSAVATGLGRVSFHSKPKERQCQRMLLSCLFWFLVAPAFLSCDLITAVSASVLTRPLCLCSLPSLRSCKDTHLWWLLGPIQIVCLGYRHLQILNLVTFAKTSFLDKESESRSVVSNSLRTVQSMEFSRPEHWSRLLFPSPGDLPKGSKPGLLHCRGSFTNWTIRFLDEVILKNSGG